jgi:hypothetical protein
MVETIASLGDVLHIGHTDTTRSLQIGCGPNVERIQIGGGAHPKIINIGLPGD